MGPPEAVPIENAPTPPAPLRRLARRFGILTSYVDAFGIRRDASAEALLAVLRARGAELEHVRNAAAAARAREEEEARRAIPPMLVAWDGRLEGGVPLRVSASRDGGQAWIRLRLEAGEAGRPGDSGKGRESAWRVDLGEAPRDGSHHRDGRMWTSLRAPLRVPLPPGIHDLCVETGGEVLETRVIAAPRRLHIPSGREDARVLGFFLPLHALRTARDWGVGSFTDLRAFVRWCEGQHGGAVATLPLLASFLDEPFDPSPYAPVSRRFWNEVFLDIEDVPGLRSCPEALARLADPVFRRTIDSLRHAEQVDYRAVQAAKRSVLEPLVRRLDTTPSGGGPSLDAFLAEHPEARRYARFRAALRRHGSSWTAWPAPLRGGVLPASLDRNPEARFHLHAQWFAHRQVEAAAAEARRRGVDLYLDFPLGVHPDGFDVWDGRGLHARGVSAGAPPDGFFPKGQDWGFPPADPDISRARGHREWIEALRHHLRVARILRVDHVMGLHRLFWIPRGLPAAQGVYVRYPSEELHAILCLESRRHGAGIAGEDLGTVPGEVRRAMRSHGMQRSYVFELELRARPTRPLPPVSRNSVASLNTHDTPTFAAYVRGLDVEDRVSLGLLDELSRAAARRDRESRLAAWRGRRRPRAGGNPTSPGAAGGAERPGGSPRGTRMLQGLGKGLPGGDDEAMLRETLCRLSRSAARWVLVNLEDLWLETNPQNVPGTTTERPNWRRRARHALEEWSGIPSVRDALAACRRGRRAGGSPPDRRIRGKRSPGRGGHGTKA